MTTSFPVVLLVCNASCPDGFPRAPELGLGLKLHPVPDAGSQPERRKADASSYVPGCSVPRLLLLDNAN